MDEKQKTELTEALNAANVIDQDIAFLPELSEAMTNGSTAIDAVAALRQRIPGLFRVTDYGAMEEKQFDEAESVFRAGLRKSRDPLPNEWRHVDAALVDGETAQALDRAVRGVVTSSDKSLLRAALAAQMRDAKMVQGDDAA